MDAVICHQLFTECEKVGLSLSPMFAYVDQLSVLNGYGGLPSFRFLTNSFPRIEKRSIPSSVTLEFKDFQGPIQINSLPLPNKNFPNPVKHTGIPGLFNDFQVFSRQFAIFEISDYQGPGDTL